MSGRWMIASDLHGDRLCTEELLRRFDESGAERLLLLGDLLYHGPRNDLPSGYDPKGVIALLSSYQNQILCVRGNCEAEVDQMVLPFPVLADYAWVEREGLSVFATHGHRFNRECLPPMTEGTVLLHGHTHVPAAEKLEGGIWYINPGSVALPKEGSPKSYLLWEGRRFCFCALDGREIKTLLID